MSKPLASIVDDDVNLTGFFRFALESADFETAVVYDGQNALRKFQELNPHLIILDLYLPDAFGGDLLRLIRDDERLRQSWVIVATGESKALDSWIEKHADFVLTKPVEYSQVHRIVSRIRDRKRNSE